MKKKDIKILVLEIVLFIFLILNSFISGVLSRYNLIMFLILLLIVCKYFLPNKKVEHKYTKGVLLEVLIFLLMFFIIYYLFGMVVGYFSAGHYFTLKGFRNYIIPIALIVIFKELLRYEIIIKSNNSKLLYVITILLFISIDVTNYLYYNSYGSIYEVMLFIMLSLLPSISKNIACSYIAKNAGALPNIIFLLVMNLYIYVIPILPNKHEYINSLIECIIPILLIIRLKLLFKKNMKLQALEEVS